MTLIAVNELRIRFPEHNIYLYSPVDLANSKLNKSIFAFDFTGWYPMKFAHCQHSALLRMVNLIRHRAELLEAETLYRNTDFIVDISGYALGSNWSAKICNDFLDVLEFAQAFGIPVYLMPQSFGPFDFGKAHPGVDERCRKLLPACKTILSREQEGYDALVSVYGLTNVQLAPDLVLNNKGIDLANVFRKIPQMNLPEIAPSSIAIVPNGRNLSVGNDKEVLELYRSAIQHGLEQGKAVYLLHHSTADASICLQLKTQFADDSRVVLLEEEFSCLEFNKLVQKFDYMVASRFHSIVHAYKNAVPCVILGWAKKYEDLATQFMQQQYLFDVRACVESAALWTAMDCIGENQDKESRKIKAHLSDVQKENVFDILGGK
jgi:colanic acid/amylovoran biosynthesis protein